MKLLALILLIAAPAIAQDIKVTNLNDSGAGSLRACMQALGQRKCVLDVAGYIDLKTPIIVSSGFLLVAGETAPSPGIHVRGARLEIKAPNVILRHFAVRPGDGPGMSFGQRDAVVVGASDVTLDHMSLTHAIDENLSTYNYASGLTVQNLQVTNCLIADALYRNQHPENIMKMDTTTKKNVYVGHSMGPLIDAGGSSLWNRNILANNNDRNIRVKQGNQIEFTNNYVFNWGRFSGSNMFNMDIGSTLAGNRIHFVGNVYKRGGASVGDHPCIYNGPGVPSGTRIYGTDNVCPSGKLTDLATEPAPIFTPQIASPMSSSDLLGSLLPEVGARPWDRFPMDVAILEEVKNGVGKIKDCITRCDTNPDGSVDVPTGPWPVIGASVPVAAPPPTVVPSASPTIVASPVASACPTCAAAATCVPTPAKSPTRTPTPVKTPTPRMCSVPCDRLEVMP